MHVRIRTSVSKKPRVHFPALFSVILYGRTNKCMCIGVRAQGTLRGSPGRRGAERHGADGTTRPDEEELADAGKGLQHAEGGDQGTPTLPPLNMLSLRAPLVFSTYIYAYNFSVLYAV